MRESAIYAHISAVIGRDFLAAYRSQDNSKVEPEAILTAHREALITDQEVVLPVHDATDLDYRRRFAPSALVLSGLRTSRHRGLEVEKVEERCHIG